MSLSDQEAVQRRRELRKNARVAVSEPDVAKRYPKKREPRMRASKGKAVKNIDWADKTVNVITGCRNYGNRHICGDYCYAHDMAVRQAGRNGYPAKNPFQPTFHPDKLEDITQKGAHPKRVFLNSMSDWFGEGVNPDWIYQIIQAVRENDQDKFLVLTKRPEEMGTLNKPPINSPDQLFKLPSNLWWGASICRERDAWRAEKLSDRVPTSHKFVSFEPLLEPMYRPLLDLYLQDIEWIIIGAESGRRKGKVTPKLSWIVDIIDVADQMGIPVFLKNNLVKVVGSVLRQEYPEALR